MLYHVIYISKAVTPLSGESLSHLLQQSRRWNESVGISGMLLYVERHMMSQITGRFMQVIEGDESEIKPLFERIKTDPRHHQIMPLQIGHIGQRSFKDWVMGFKVMGWQDYMDHPGYLDMDELFSDNEITLSSGVALNFMKTFYAM
ncbi:BLUF domain-containing protein [Mucilaginibacter sp. CSA2-8R]|uniref:BLUF domain-containing protein n=1 Tax=Mucilaginibacter sp. CSA2-8R TaxID=3141542 RepID=UPI00315C989E